jgi:sulfatase modifying factor 1
VTKMGRFPKCILVCMGWLALLLMPLAQAQAQAQAFKPMDNKVTDRVILGDWAIDRTEVTMGQFDRYVRATGTVTRAEKEGGGFEYGAGWERRPGWSWRFPDGQSDGRFLRGLYWVSLRL